MTRAGLVLAMAQAQELDESERKLVGLCHAHGTALIEIHDLKKELAQAKGNYAIQKAAADDYEQQLAASQARCAKFEAIVHDHQNGACNRTIAQLQATLAAREAEIDRLKLAQQHSIQDECEAEQRLIDAGISDYEDGGQGEYRGLLTQIDLCIKERDAAVQQLNELRGRLKDE